MNLFIFSKILWFLISPLNLIFILVLIIFVLNYFGKIFISKFLLYFTIFFIFIVCILPVGPYLNYLLEKEFHNSNFYPVNLDGILILAGATNPNLTKEHNQVTLNGSAERLTESINLINKYPNARIVFSGGSGSLKYPNLSHATAAHKFFINMGIPTSKIKYEQKSRNTYENILFTKKIVLPKDNEKWLVVTSASHLKRVINISEKLDWNLIPYATDFNSSKNFFENYTFNMNFISNMNSFNYAVHEWIGIISYYLMGRSSRIF